MHVDIDETVYSILLLNHTWLAPELRSLGHEVITAGWAHGGFDVVFNRLDSLESLYSKLPEGFAPTHVVYYDDSYSVSLLGLERLAVPLLFYSIDVHHHHAWHKYLAELSDLTFVAQRDYLQLLKDSVSPSVPIEWLPLWATLPMQPAAERDIPVCFRGSLDPVLHPERKAFFEAVSARVPVDAATGSYLDDYPRSKIVLNQAIGNDVNFRIFEALMAGALLITPKVSNGFDELFRDGIDLVTFASGNAEQAADLVEYYLEHPAEASEIAARGREIVLTRHSGTHRAALLVSKLAALVRDERRDRSVWSAALSLSAMSTYRNVKRDEDGRNPWHERLLLHAAGLLVSSPVEPDSAEEARSLVYLCACFIENCLSVEDSIDFLSRICDSRDDLMLKLCLADELVRNDRPLEALEIAEQLSPEPEQLLAALPEVLLQAREQVYQALGSANLPDACPE